MLESMLGPLAHDRPTAHLALGPGKLFLPSVAPAHAAVDCCKKKAFVGEDRLHFWAGQTAPQN